MTRETFQKSLRDVQDAVLVMGSMVEKAIERSTQVMKLRDLEMARTVIDEDEPINEQRFAIEEQCLSLIARQAPMASDLRILAAALNIITDLERMADHAAGNARIAILIGDEPPLKPLIDIPRMANISIEMLHGALEAFVARDSERAVQIALRDDEVDILYDQIYRELLIFMMADPSTINRATHLLWAAHNLERIADRVTNICERVVFLSTGRMSEIRGLAERSMEAEIPGNSFGANGKGAH